MDPLTPTADARTLARRKLLRGSFAAPAVLTMASGSALAATSATCLAKATASPSTADLAQGTPSDTFLRVRLLVRPNGVHLVTRASFGSVSVSTSFWGSTTLWQRVSVSNSNPNGPKNQTYGNEMTTAVPANATASNYWIALRFDAAGNIVGLGDSGTGSVVGTSCWTSLHPPPP